jgi:hypothetical protein
MGKRVLESYWLCCHPDTPAKNVTSIEVSVERAGGRLLLRYSAECVLMKLALADPAEPSRTDDLWKSTCFEAFIGHGSYSEFNFSPSSEWAAYDFESYRAGMRNRMQSSDPQIGLDGSENHFGLEATIDVSGLAGQLALSAVIEETDGTKSYWALAHPPGAPDFHHPTCFAATLPAPEMP